MIFSKANGCPWQKVRSLRVAEHEAVLSIPETKSFSEIFFAGGKMPSSVRRGGSFQFDISTSDPLFLDEQTNRKDGFGFGACDQSGVL
jgi:hypothetical protein